jgi:hypothetical protein
MFNFFSKKQIFTIPATFFGLILTAHFVLRQLRLRLDFDMDNFWPISIFLPKLPVWQDIFVLLAIIILFVFFLRTWQQKKSFFFYFILAIILMLSTNLFQGFEDGFVRPITGRVKSDAIYLNDAVKISSYSNFLAKYTTIQPKLGDHGRVHPPGAISVFYFLAKLDNPILISLFLILSGSLSSLIIFSILKQNFSLQISKFSAILFLLIPAVQIYFVSSLDALICTLFLACFWAWQKNNDWKWFGLSFLFLWLSSFITFAFLILIPVLLIDDWLRNKNIIKSILLFSLLTMSYWLTANFIHFNYLKCFWVAKSFEGSKGFYLFASPLSYFFTRIENIIEILLFLGPYLTFILINKLPVIASKFILSKVEGKQSPTKMVLTVQKLNPMVTSSFIALLSLFLFFLTGAYYTGETARAAIYIYPFIFILLAYFFEKAKISQKDQKLMFVLVFAQSLIMQLFGWYI